MTNSFMSKRSTNWPSIIIIGWKKGLFEKMMVSNYRMDTFSTSDFATGSPDALFEAPQTETLKAYLDVGH